MISECEKNAIKICQNAKMEYIHKSYVSFKSFLVFYGWNFTA